MVKILHAGSLDMKFGGPALSTYLTLKGVKLYGMQADCIMPPLSDQGVLIGDDIHTIYTRPVMNKRFMYMPKLGKTLKEAGTYDLYHIQGVWQYMGVRVAKYARECKKPYVISLRGLMYPDAMKTSGIAKRISLALYQKKTLQEASCIQATCEEEMIHYRNLGFTNPVALIPNPIETQGYVDRPIVKNETTTFGYLGRVHPRKRIERIIYAFAGNRAVFDKCKLVIIGSDIPSYENFLKAEVERLNLRNVEFTGFLTGNKKDEAISGLSYLVVPSDFENFGNIVTEALVRGVPVIASKGMPWKELEDFHCGWWVNNDQNTIDKALLEAAMLKEEERIVMGQNGKQLMKTKYSVEVLGEKMTLLYKWILKQSPKPEFVF